MYTVLYVDDEQVLLDLAKVFLERSPDFCVKTQISAHAALNSPLITSCDVIVSDYQMPEMDGIEFLKAIRKRFGALPFILFTGRGREEVVIEAINNGVDFYLQKGGDPKSQFAELSHKIRMAVERKRAVDEHIESDKRLSSIFHASPIHQMITEFSTGRILDINDRFLKDLKIPGKEVIGRTMDEIGLFIDKSRYSAIIQQLEEEGIIRKAELLIRDRSGRTYTTLTSLTRVQVHGQDLIYTQSMDITAQKNAQQTINALLNAAPDASLLFNTDGTILAANNAASARYTIPIESMIGMNAFSLVSSGGTDLQQAKVKEALATRNPLVYIDNRADHSFEDHLYPVIGSEGEVASIAVYSRDVTDENRAEQALKESEEKYRLVVEHSHDSIYIYRDDHFLFINRQAEELSGFSHDELMRRELWDFIHPDDRKRLKEAAAKRFAGGHVSSVFQAKILRKNGEVREGEFFVDLIDFLGKPAILGIARDITGKKRAEEEIRERSEQLRSLSDNLPSGMVYQIVIEPDGKRRFIHVSAGVERVHEVTPGEVLQDPSVLYNQIIEEDRLLLKEAEDRAFASMSPFSFEARIRTPSGLERWILLRSAPRSQSGGGTLWDGIELDITASKQADAGLKAAYDELAASQEELRGQFDALKTGQERLQESEELYRSLFTASPDGIAMVDTKGILTYVSPKALEMFGLSVPEEAIGTRVFDWIVDEDQSLAGERFKQVQSDNDFVSHIYRVHRKDGSQFFVEMHSAAIHNSNGSVRGLISILRDISDRKYAEKALQESEENYRRIIENMQDVFYRTNREGIITMISPYGARLVGFDSTDEIIGKYRATDFYADPIHRDVFLAYLGREHVVSGYPLTLKDRYGELHFATASSRILYDTDGEVTGVEGILHDITEERKSETTLAESEELHRKMVAAMPDIVVQVDLDGNIIYINENGVKMAGLAGMAEATGKSMFSFFAPESLPLAMENTRLMFERPLGPVEYAFLLKDGTRVSLEVNGDVLRTPGGCPYGMVYICRDITERRQAETALRESEENYRHIIENMQDVFYRINREGIITMISTYGARLVGFESADEIIGKYKATDFYAFPEERDEFLTYISRDGMVSGYPLTLKDRNGELHYATASSRLLYDTDGKINGIEGILHDITHLKQVENALRQANRQILLMTSITRHDIRNQLMVLGGWLELSRASVSDPDHMLELITKEQHIASVIQEQIDFTSFFDDMGVKEPAWLDPVTLIQNSKSVLPFKNILLDLDISGIEIFADPLFEKVFYNLLDNALRYGGDTMTTIRVAAHREGSSLVLEVEDDGGGISEQDREYLFDRGYGKNTGLGLFLVKEILAITGMTIRETGIPGKGARFEIMVPAGKYRVTKAGSQKL
jgi:PAS domain S-box-containing protein